MAGEIRETAITIDHEDGICLVDTTEAWLAVRFRKLGFQEITRKDSGRYFRFKGEARQIRWGRKEKRQHTPEEIARATVNIKAARAKKATL
ncbi:MAG: hypothetical protein U1E51_07090 [Candidatus Binatia bacterium]|nr:hypothetical protein [Candidatus Binatia bacterium]